MYPGGNRIDPIRLIIFSLLFPGYWYWKEGRKIEGFSLSVAVYFGYFVILGYYLHLYLLWRSWRNCENFNKRSGFQHIDALTNQRMTMTGLIAGIFCHPFYLFLTLYWAITLGLGRSTSNGFQVNLLIYIVMLLIIYVLRFLLFFALNSIRNKDHPVNNFELFSRFSKNHASSIVFIPFFPLFLLPIGELFVNFLYLFILPNSAILGIRILFNNLKIFRSDIKN